jgi:hypothetical protein
MFCQQCGAQISEVAQYCSRCGALLPTPPPPPGRHPPPPSLPPGRQPTPPPPAPIKIDTDQGPVGASIVLQSGRGPSGESHASHQKRTHKWLYPLLLLPVTVGVVGLSWDGAEKAHRQRVEKERMKDPTYAASKRAEQAEWEKTRAAMKTLEAQRDQVSAPELMSSYTQNEVAADEQYKGRVLIVTGVVTKIGKDILGSPYITLETGQRISSVQCIFPTSSSHRLASTKLGSSVVIRGKCSGKLMNVLLRDCELF